MSVTGGMSRTVGALCTADEARADCGISPVRTIGGDRREDIALCASSLIWLKLFCVAVSRVPPIDVATLAMLEFDPRRDLLREESYCGNGNCDLMEGDCGYGD